MLYSTETKYIYCFFNIFVVILNFENTNLILMRLPKVKTVLTVLPFGHNIGKDTLDCKNKNMSVKKSL